MFTRSASFGLVLLACSLAVGCSIGPRALETNRLRYNEAIKRTTEEQLLLNIVRLRYTDSPSSLSVTSIAAQHELVKSLKLMPFFAASGDANPIGLSTLLPQIELNTADRPTLALTPQDDQDFTKRLFTPIPLEGVVYLSKTTWPIATVFRLYLENINWVSNAETASGPTPKAAPIYAEFLSGVEALQRMQDRKIAAFFAEEREEKISEGLPTTRLAGHDVLEAAKAAYEFRKDDKKDTWTLLKKKQQGILRIDAKQVNDPDVQEFCRVFKLKHGQTSYDIVADKADPFLADAPKDGMTYLDLESRSLLQVLFFMSHGIHVPEEHVRSGQAPSTFENDDTIFDWQPVLNNLFEVSHCKSRQRPPQAHVAIQYQGYWFYIDARDRDSKATFALIMELARLELAGKTGASAPLLTLPLGGR
jgi:hypothetical protein